MPTPHGLGRPRAVPFLAENGQAWDGHSLRPGGRKRGRSQRQCH